MALDDGVVCILGNARRINTQEAWLEKDFRASKTLTADCDHPNIRELITILKTGAVGSCKHLLKVRGNTTEPLLHKMEHFTLCSVSEVITMFCEDPHQLFRQVKAS